MLEISDRCAFSIVTDLVRAGYIVKEKAGRRNRYRIEIEAALRESIGAEQSIGELLELLLGSSERGSALVPEA
jgi:hypothetical protein